MVQVVVVSDPEANTPTKHKPHFTAPIQFPPKAKIPTKITKDGIEYPIRNLIFEGGGSRGIAYLGALEVLEELNILKDVVNVIGTSAGAISTLLLSVGYTVDELNNLYKNEFDLKKFKDKTPWQKGGFLKDTARLLSKGGYCKGDFLQNWLKEKVAYKTGNPNLTFAQLQALRKKNPENFLNLYLVAANLETKSEVIFNAELTPNVPIAVAARASASFPLLFPPIELQVHDGLPESYFKNGTTKAILVDGGVLLNYPINIINSKTDANVRKDTIGIRLDSTDEIAELRDGNDAQPDKKKNTLLHGVLKVGRNLFKTALNSQKTAHKLSGDQYRTIYIDTKEIRSTNFNLKEFEKKELISEGRNATKVFIAERLPELIEPNRQRFDRL